MISAKNLQHLKHRFDAARPARRSKVMPLAEAVRTFVRPGMKLNPAGRPSAAFYEICRQFKGSRPQFEYISTTLSGTFLPLVHLKLLKKAVCSYLGDAYPTPGPSLIAMLALDRGELEVENWTMLTICQRLLAGALGVPFITTRSLVGSSLGAELPHAFREIEDPFAEGGATGLIKAYRPDISFAHVLAADAAGNSISFPPFGENVYGALGAREGVILTAEHIVDTDYIRRYANLARIPAEKVLSVSHVPYGAHPSGLYVRNIPEIEPYGNDYAFMKDHRRAQKDEESYDKWVQEWILNIPDHETYINKIGSKSVERIHFAADPEAWRQDLDACEAMLQSQAPANAIERMVIQASREVAKRMYDNQYKTILAGIGQASLSAILAWHALRDRQYDFALMAELGWYDYDPRPADSFLFNFRNLSVTTLLTDIHETLGIHTGGATNRCMGVLGAAQLDRWGNVNSIRMNGKFIVGSGGANDIATASRQTVVVAQQGKGQFVREVEHITCPGERIQCVVTTKGRFEKCVAGELVLTGYMAEPGDNEEASVRRIKDLVDWDLRISPAVERLEPPGDDDLLLLRAYDSERFFIGKIPKAE